MDALKVVKAQKKPNLLSLAKAALVGGYTTASELVKGKVEDIKNNLKNVYENKIIPGVSTAISSTDSKTLVKI